VTPDELGDAWSDSRVHLPLISRINGQEFGRPEAGVDMTFNFAQLISHVTKTRRLGAGAIVGSGTVSNYDRGRGSSCLAEKRTLEQLEHGAPRTPFLKFGDRVSIEMLDARGRTVFGALDNRVVRAG
jgi:fumarylacetoacetate (FAA) hydrolase